MKQFIKSYWKTLLFFTLIGLIGGFATFIYQIESIPAEELQQLMLEQGLTKPTLVLVTLAQSVGYGLVLGALGIFFARRVGLWKDETSLTRKPLMASLAVSVAGGLALILPDLLFFGRYSEAIMNVFAEKPTPAFMIAALTYGAVIEEVMMRLFMMSLIAFVLHKLFTRKQDMPPAWILIAANVVSALLFAAGHLPATFVQLGNSPIIIFRCFLLNGVFGLLFGYLYRKYGLRYAMLAHGGCHVISKLIWILFI